MSCRVLCMPFSPSCDMTRYQFLIDTNTNTNNPGQRMYFSYFPATMWQKQKLRVSLLSATGI